MKNLCRIISLILIISIIFLGYLVKNNILETSSTQLPNINALIYSIIVGFLAFCSGFVLNQGQVEELKTTSVKKLRKAEKACIDTKESLDKIDRLNAKIETLEIALQEAIKNKKNHN